MLLEDTLLIILHRLDNMQELLQLSINALNSKKNVSKFLNKSEKTIDNYIKNNTFKKGIHYFINEKERIEFIPLGILDFKKSPKIKIEIKEDDKKDLIKLSETSSNILKGLL